MKRIGELLMSQKKICFSLPCYNELENVRELAMQIMEICDTQLPAYQYTLQFIDNCSTDGTQAELEKLCAEFMSIRAVFNARNFKEPSGFYGLMQTDGECSIVLPTDFQVPLTIIPELVHQWETGRKIVCAIKPKSKENAIMRGFRQMYYALIKRFSSVEQISNFTGAGLYDSEFLDFCRSLNDPAPSMRGIVAEFGYDVGFVSYTEQKRKHGKSKNDFYSLFDLAMKNFTTYTSVIPRMATFSGLIIGVFSFFIALYYLIMKLRFWQTFQAGMAPLVVGLFFFSGVILIFIGLLGEYMLSINTRIIARPLVIERKRVGFRTDDDQKKNQDASKIKECE
jgi:polyisoprenyl-phosphate glycosyltransferase